MVLLREVVLRSVNVWVGPNSGWFLAWRRLAEGSARGRLGSSLIRIEIKAIAFDFNHSYPLHSLIFGQMSLLFDTVSVLQKFFF